MTRAPDIYDALDRAAAEIAEAIGQSSDQSMASVASQLLRLATDKPLKENTIGQFSQFGQSKPRSYYLDHDSEIDFTASSNHEAEVARVESISKKLVKLVTLAKDVEIEEKNCGQSCGQSASQDARLASTTAIEPDNFAIVADRQAIDPAGSSLEFPLWTDDHDERAAIAEFEGGTPTDWAEGFARLNLAQPPCDVPPLRWERFIDDAGRFIDGGWAVKAAGLGWPALALFGCDRRAPFARIDQAGLLWLLNGRRLVAMTDEAAVIECEPGVRQTYRRMATQPGRALAWEIVP